MITSKQSGAKRYVESSHFLAVAIAKQLEQRGTDTGTFVFLAKLLKSRIVQQQNRPSC